MKFSDAGAEEEIAKVHLFIETSKLTITLS
jgi:hypothetical protein